MEPLNVFIAYSHVDADYLQELIKHLKPLVMDKYLYAFHDQDVPTTGDWDKVIQKKIKIADLVIFLLSPDLLSSDYVTTKELPDALKRWEKRSQEVLFVPVERVCLPSSIETKKLALDPNRPVSSYNNHNDAWYKVAVEVKKLLLPEHARSIAGTQSVHRLKELQDLLPNYAKAAKEIRLCSRTGVGWGRDIPSVFEQDIKQGKNRKHFKAIFLDPSSTTFDLDSALNWKPSTDSDARIWATIPTDRKHSAMSLCDAITGRGYNVRVTDIFIPAVFWLFLMDDYTDSISGSTVSEGHPTDPEDNSEDSRNSPAEDKSTQRKSALFLEVPIMQSSRGGNLYVRLAENKPDFSAYAMFFTTLWKEARAWPRANCDIGG